MIINLWTESSAFEKIRFMIFMIALFVLGLAFFFPNAFIRHETESLIDQCERYNSEYSGRFVVINGEAIPICE